MEKEKAQAQLIEFLAGGRKKIEDVHRFLVRDTFTDSDVAPVYIRELEEDLHFLNRKWDEKGDIYLELESENVFLAAKIFKFVNDNEKGIMNSLMNAPWFSHAANSASDFVYYLLKNSRLFERSKMVSQLREVVRDEGEDSEWKVTFLGLIPDESVDTPVSSTPDYADQVRDMWKAIIKAIITGNDTWAHEFLISFCISMDRGYYASVFDKQLSLPEAAKLVFGMFADPQFETKITNEDALDIFVEESNFNKSEIYFNTAIYRANILFEWLVDSVLSNWPKDGTKLIKLPKPLINIKYLPAILLFTTMVANSQPTISYSEWFFEPYFSWLLIEHSKETIRKEQEKLLDPSFLNLPPHIHTLKDLSKIEVDKISDGTLHFRYSDGNW